MLSGSLNLKANMHLVKEDVLECYLHIYNAAKKDSRKINKLFRINSAGAGVVKYNNKISAHTRRLINYFELMYAKTM